MKESATIYFHTSDEWDSLQKANPELFQKTILPDVQKAAMEGVFAQECIAPQRISKNLRELDDLKYYVTPSGKYTPFVAWTELVVNSDLIKDVIIVDTPGINDPDETRSKVTSDWIQDSSAVIYLFMANQPLAGADIDFIDEHLASIPSSLMVFALSKADLIEANDIQRAKIYAESNLKSIKQLADRRLLDDQEIHPISVMAAVVQAKRLSGSKLGDDDRFYIGKIDACLLEQSGWLPQFTQAIDERIMRNSANGVLSKARASVQAACDWRLRKLDKECELVEQRIKDLQRDLGELESRRKQINSVLKSVKSVEDSFSLRRSSLQKKLANRAGGLVSRLKTRLFDDFEKWLMQASAEYAVTVAGHQLRTRLERGILEAFDEVLPAHAADEIEQLQQEFETSLKAISKEILPDSSPAFIPVLD